MGRIEPFDSGEHQTHGAALKPPRFTLRTMLVFVTALCGVFALMSSLGMVWSAALGLLLCLASAHVLGNSLGTRLRDEATRHSAEQRLPRDEPPMHLQEARASQPLTQRARLHRIAPASGVVGALVGGELGGILAAYVYPEAPPGALGAGRRFDGGADGLGGLFLEQLSVGGPPGVARSLGRERCAARPLRSV